MWGENLLCVEVGRTHCVWGGKGPSACARAHTQWALPQTGKGERTAVKEVHSSGLALARPQWTAGRRSSRGSQFVGAGGAVTHCGTPLHGNTDYCPLTGFGTLGSLAGAGSGDFLYAEEWQPTAALASKRYGKLESQVFLTTRQTPEPMTRTDTGARTTVSGQFDAVRCQYCRSTPRAL